MYPVSAGSSDTVCETQGITAWSQRGATVCLMSPRPTATLPPAFDAEQWAGRALTVDRGMVFHNSSITRSVSRRVMASHQVLHESTPNGPHTDFDDTREALSALGFRTTTQRATGESVMSWHCPIPCSAHGERSAGRPFQGGGTGSNPVGGARRCSWSKPVYNPGLSW